MSKRFIFLVSLLATFLIFCYAGNILSEEAGVPTQEVFSDYYHFGSIAIELQPGNVSYLPGESVTFKGKITNTNDYPMINGQLYERIVQENKTNFFQNGDLIIDEFFAVENINLKAHETKAISFSWQIPQTAMKGNYKLTSYFTVDKKYNMSGLSFSSNIFGAFCTFQIEGDNNPSIFFDRNNVKFNGNTYLFRAFIPTVTTKDKAEIVIPVKNTYSTKKEVQITYDLYWWDGLKTENKLKTTSETITVPANSQKNIKYTLDGFDRTVYYLNITAQSGTDKSIIPIRFGVTGTTEARINFIGANKFPLAQGEKTKAFVTFHSTSFTDFEGKIDLAVKDLKGKVLATKSFPGPITGNVSVLTLDTPTNLRSFTVESNLYDKNNNIVDTASVTYQEEQAAASDQSSSNRILQICIAVLLVILLAAIVFVAVRMKQRKNRISLFFFLMLSGGILFATSFVWSSIKYDISIPPAHDLSQTIISNQRVADLGVAGAYYHNTALTVNYDPVLKQEKRILSDGDTVCPGQKIDFVLNKDGEWWTSGYVLDSPAAYWTDGGLVPIFSRSSGRTILNSQAFANFTSLLPNEGCSKQDLLRGFFYAPLIIKNPKASLSGGPEISCSGIFCRVGNTKNISTSITATINGTVFQQVTTRVEKSEKIFGPPTYCAPQNEFFASLQPVTKTWNLKIGECKTPPIKPVISNPSSTAPDWCQSSQYVLNWQVNTTQKAKRIQVSESSDFNSLAYDSGLILNNSTTQTLPAVGSDSGSILKYDKTYYWRAKVWNTENTESDWSSTQTFITPKHQYPDPSFNKNPVAPKIGQTIKFTDTSTAYSSSIQSWSWTFQDGTPSSSILQNPSVIFNSSGNKTISLTVKDTDGYSCSTSSSSNSSGGSSGSGGTGFHWIEIAP